MKPLTSNSVRQHGEAGCVTEVGTDSTDLKVADILTNEVPGPTIFSPQPTSQGLVPTSHGFEGHVPFVNQA